MTIATESLSGSLLLQYHPTISSTATRYQPPASPRSERLETKAIPRKSIVMLETVTSRHWRIRRENMAVDVVTIVCTEHLKENAHPWFGCEYRMYCDSRRAPSTHTTSNQPSVTICKLQTGHGVGKCSLWQWYYVAQWY